MKTSHFARGITPEQKKCSKSSLIYLLCELNLLLMVPDLEYKFQMI